ncbi:MAG TPA: ribosome recycling factor [Candidatus Saccharimonadales bacterium]|nr:ribosome recycling factor [Candidatus Saccharimonadales bacterium]
MDIRQYEDKMKQAYEHFLGELKKVRTGRANAAMLDGVMVTAYGTQMPLNQVSNVTAPEAQLLQITPFDPTNIQAIASAIRDNPTLGLNPSDDGRVVRVPIPALTEDRRREYVKLLNSKVEDCMIAMRGVRRDAIDAIAQAKKDKAVGEDDAKRLEKQVDDAMAKVKVDVDSAAKAKENEIMTI